jgi:hypothetical protein
VNSANGLIRPSDKAALADLIGTIDLSCGIMTVGAQRTNEGSPARWRLVDKE